MTLVGRGMRSLLHRMSGVLAEFGALDVHLISQSSNNLNLTFVVDEALADDLIPRLHALLIRADALRAEDGAVFGPSWRELAAEAAAPRRETWWMRRREELLRLAAQGTPRYVYALDAVREQARALRTLSPLPLAGEVAPAGAGEGSAVVRSTSIPHLDLSRERERGSNIVDRWHYALKANPHPAILRTLDEEGFAFECVSMAEVEAVRATLPQLAAERILFTPNFAPREEYAQALQAGVRTTLDALHPLQHWGELFREREIHLRLDLASAAAITTRSRPAARRRNSASRSIRWKSSARWRAGTAHASSACTRIWARASSTRRTGARSTRSWRAWPKASAASSRSTSAAGSACRRGRTKPCSISPALGAALAEVKSAYPQFRLWLEPGRFLVADAGVLLARVTQVKRKGTVHYVGIDAGMNSLIRPALYEAWHEIVNLTRLGEPAQAMVQVVGPICETGDVLGANRRLPECREGDVILIAQAGAYGAVMASRYNLREPAAEIVL